MGNDRAQEEWPAERTTRDVGSGRIVGMRGKTEVGMSDASPRPISLMQRVKELEETAIMLHDALNGLDERVDPLLVPARDAESKEGYPEDPPQQSPLAEQLETLIRRYRHAVTRVADLRNRLEI